MDRKHLLLLVAILMGVLLTAGFLASNLNGGDIDCEEVYNKTVSGEKDPGDIPEKCKPLPEEVEKKVLARALAG